MPVLTLRWLLTLDPRVQFATSSYTSLGDPYAKKGNVLPRCGVANSSHSSSPDPSASVQTAQPPHLPHRYEKKQFLTEPSKKGRTKDTLFGRAFPFLADVRRRLDPNPARKCCETIWSERRSSALRATGLVVGRARNTMTRTRTSRRSLVRRGRR